MKVLIDEMNLVFISFNVAKRQAIENTGEFTKKDIGLFYHLFINKLNELSKTYGELIFCGEGRNSTGYRKSIYPLYKENRDRSEETYLIIKDEFPTIDKLIRMYKTKFISIDGAEADDCIYALSMYFSSLGEDVLIVSGDGDLTQLHNYNEKINVFNPIRNSIVYPKANILEYKSIVGDASDNIKGIPRLGEKTFQKMMEDKAFFEEKMKGKMELFEQIMNIVDLRKYPKEYHEKAVELYNSTEWNDFDFEGIEKFMVEKGLIQHVKFWWQTVADIQSRLRGDSIVKDMDVEDAMNNTMYAGFDLDEVLNILQGENETNE